MKLCSCARLRAGRAVKACLHSLRILADQPPLELFLKIPMPIIFDFPIAVLALGALYFDSFPALLSNAAEFR
jgi:hypothetical protein